MIEFSDEQWNVIADEVDKTVNKAIDDLPPVVQGKAEQIACVVDKYQFRLEEWKNAKVLGCWNPSLNTIFIFAGQIYEDCSCDLVGAMESVRQVYYHELAHAIGDLAEYEVKALGL
jgi:predicted Zn-dependent protease with MMP-like domain